MSHKLLTIADCKFLQLFELRPTYPVLAPDWSREKAALMLSIPPHFFATFRLAEARNF